MVKIDRNGRCPNCDASWEGIDILEHLKHIAIFSTKTENELVKIAKGFGWSKDKPLKFSKVIVHHIGGVTYLECSEVLCRHAFNSETGEEFESIFNLKNVINGNRIINSIGDTEPEDDEAGQ